MACLTFYRNARPVMRHRLKDVPLDIGRDQACGIQLTEEDVSRIHSSITYNNGGYVISDKSSNGTFVNGNRISSHRLSHGDSIVIADWTIRFDEGPSDISCETVIRERSQTKVLCYGPGKNEVVTEGLEMTVVLSNGEKKKFRLSNAVIGTAATNDIVITGDDYVSSRHCRITGRENEYIIEDLGSRNGTFLDGRRVKLEALPAAGEITVGRTVIKFGVERKKEKIRPSMSTSLGPIYGRSEAMRVIFSLIEKIAPSDATVCLIGASGTGKELFARYIHEASPRAARPFVAINCGSIPANLIESEFFGHERGSFTSATNQHRGVFEQAGGGTLFLDEIGEMPLDLQTRLLRILETRMLRRVGGQTDIPVDVRIVAATNRDLGELVKAGRFREDLFYRLFVVPVFIPPLNERKEDIGILAEHFLRELSPEGCEKRFDAEALNRLSAYSWPGNVRELRNTIQRAILISNSDVITKNDIIFSAVDCGSVASANLAEQEKRSIISALARNSGNVSEASRQLGIARTTLIGMLKRHGISIGEFKG